MTRQPINKLHFNKILDFLKNKRILITTHDQADIDAIASTIVFRDIVKNLFPAQEVYLYIPHLSQLSHTFLGKIAQKYPNFTLIFNPDFNFYEIDVLIVLDTNSLEQVFLPQNHASICSSLPCLFIDHHYPSPSFEKKHYYEYSIIKPEISSTCEIIFEISKLIHFDLSLPHKVLLLSGLLTDSGFFSHGNNDTVKRAALLLNHEISLDDIRSHLEEEISLSEKIAVIKGFQRVKLIRENDWLIGISHIGSYEAIVAGYLIKMGFDVGIVYSEKKDGFRISTRARSKLCKKQGLNLALILEASSEICKGNGGGHSCAASINGKTQLELTLDIILKKIIKALKEHPF